MQCVQGSHPSCVGTVETMEMVPASIDLAASNQSDGIPALHTLSSQ